MLVNYEKKTIIVTPFKNFSTTLEKIFSDQNWRKIYGSHPHISGENLGFPDLYDKHNNVVSQIFLDDGYEIILPIRNPYDRVASFWKHSQMVYGDIIFDKWFFEDSKYACCLPVTRTYKYHHLVRVENLTEDFESLDIKIDFVPHLNKSVKKSQEFTDIQKEQIYYLHYEDFKNGGYEK